jgi:hypothetical protein
VTAEIRSEPFAIVVALGALMAPRTDPPTALERAHVALRRIGYVGRPVVFARRRLGARELPEAAADREAWVRATLGGGGYRVIVAEESEQSGSRGGGSQPAVDAWRSVRDEVGAAWLLSDRAADVAPAREAGLKVILIAPADVERRALRPSYRARDLRDAVGYLLVADVFAEATAHGGPARAGGGGDRDA